MKPTHKNISKWNKTNQTNYPISIGFINTYGTWSDERMAKYVEDRMAQVARTDRTITFHEASSNVVFAINMRNACKVFLGTNTKEEYVSFLKTINNTTPEA